MGNEIIRGSPQLIKTINREMILQCVRSEGKVSRVGLSKLTGLSKPGISSIVNSLIEEGLLRETGRSESRVGRRPVLLEINPERFSIVGVVFEGTKLTVALADLSGQIVSEKEIIIVSSIDTSSFLELLEKEIALLLSLSRITYQEVLGIGLGLPDKFVLLGNDMTFVPSVDHIYFPLINEIENRFKVPIILENDVNLMALGEFYIGAGVGADSLVYVHIGTGIGAGFVLNGQLYRGSGSAAGEIGFMVVGDPPIEGARKCGWFEANYSSSAICSRLLLDENLSYLSGIDDKGKLFSESLNLIPNSSLVQKVLLDACQHWAYGLANICSVLNPELIVLGGDVVTLGDWALQNIKLTLEELVPIVPRLFMTRLGDRAGVAGAVYQVLQSNRSFKGQGVINSRNGEM